MTEDMPLHQRSLEVIDGKIRSARLALVYPCEGEPVRENDDALVCAQYHAKDFTHFFEHMPLYLPDKFPPQVCSQFIAQELTTRLNRIRELREELVPPIVRNISKISNTDEIEDRFRSDFLPL